MKKIPSLYIYQEGRGNGYSTIINPECQWVTNEPFIAHHKLDGTSCLYDGKQWYKRYMLREGKTPPPNFIPANKPVNGKIFGWVPITIDDPSSKWHRKAINNLTTSPKTGTYELCGPKINTNRENLETHQMLYHADTKVYHNVPTDYHALKEYFQTFNGEGIVFYHADGRMCKAVKANFKQ